MSDERRANYFKSLLTTREHAKEIHLSANKLWFLKKWRDYFQKICHAKLLFETKSIIFGDSVRFLETLFPCLCAIYLVYLVSVNKISSGDAVFLTGLAGTLKWSVKQLIDLITKDIYEKTEIIEKFENFLGDNMIECNEKLERYQAESEEEGEKQIEPFREIILDCVSYTYPNAARPAICGINLKIKKGEVVSILGYNGSGKTTFALLLSSLIDKIENGKILIDGQEIERIPVARNDIACLFQDYEQYHMMILDNIKIGRKGCMITEEEIWSLLKKVGLDEYVSTLPNGIHTLLGQLEDEGTGLSKGQWQRLAIARLMADDDAKVWILDEPTASLDPLSEIELYHLIMSAAQDKMVFFISHRLGFAKQVSRILLFCDGEIIGDSTHDRLIEEEHYKKMFESQGSWYV